MQQLMQEFEMILESVQLNMNVETWLGYDQQWLQRWQSSNDWERWNQTSQKLLLAMQQHIDIIEARKMIWQ